MIKGEVKRIRASIVDYIDDTGHQFSRAFTARGIMYRVAFRDSDGPVWVKGSL
jgi:predicted lactoylglutathione lyase